MPERTHRAVKLAHCFYFFWAPHEFKWEQEFKALEEFYEENSHSLVRRGYVTDHIFKLGNWASDQRNNKELNPNRVKRLDRLGFA